MSKNLLISNRATPLEYGSAELPARIHIVPRGELPNKEAGVTQILDDKAIDSILADLKNKAGGLYMGEEHFIYDPSRSSEAFAWGKQFGADEHGIWVENPEFTDVGGAAIKNKRFKWTSFVADPAQAGAVEKLGPNRFRILKIDSVGFTNYANGKALLTPISNRNTFPGSCESGAFQTNNERPNTMKSIATKLGLAPEASEDAILGEVIKLQNRAAAAEGQVTPLTTERDQFKNRATALETEVCEALLDGCGIKGDDKRRPHLISGLTPLKNRAERITHLADFGIKPVEAKVGAGVRILNRGEGKMPEAVTEAGDEQAKAGKIRNRADQLVAGGMKFEPAWAQATRETANEN